MIFLLIILLFFIPIPKKWFQKKFWFEKKYPLLKSGSWNDVYDAGNKVIKKIKGIDTNNIQLQSIKIGIYNEKYTNLIMIIIHKIAVYFINKSILIKKNKCYDSPFFPTIYEHNNHYSIHQKINKTLQNNCPSSLSKQFHQLNHYLDKKGFVLDDIHHNNIHMGDDGYIKIIDGEIFSKKEYYWYTKIVSWLDKRNNKTLQYKNANNIYYWNIGEKSAEDICFM